MLDKAELKRRRAQSRRDKERNRREEEEKEGAEAEAERRRAQSQRDKARNRRETEDRLVRAFRRQPVSVNQPNLPATVLLEAVPGASPSITSPLAIMEARSVKLIQNIANMFNDAKYSDATVAIHGKKLPVHKSVICTQSEYFEKAFEEKYREGSSGVIAFDKDSGAACWRVFEFLYTGDYSDDLSHHFQDDPELLKEPRVYALADRYFLPDLKTVATEKLQQKLVNLWTDDSFPDCIREIYETTPDSDQAMRSAVIEVVKLHARELSTKAAFKDLIHEGGDFAVQCFESVVFQVPSPVPTTHRQTNTIWGTPSRSGFGQWP